MNALGKKLVRDLRHIRGQVLATSLVVACGIASFVTMRSTYNSLRQTQDNYYSTYRFADIFAHLKRAPESVRIQIERLPGVSSVQTRVISEVAVNLPGVTEPAQAKLVSIPPQQAPMLNDLHLMRGTYIGANRPDEVIISERFADANRFEPGDRIEANINGRLRKLTIVGVALSPEYIYEIRPGDIFPDNRRYGTIWMNRKDLASAFQMDGAFNDVTLTIAPRASSEGIIEALDRILEPYGGLGAYDRTEQQSYKFLNNEFSELRTFGTILPLVFLLVTAFILHLVLSRLVKTEREQIGLLKAFGYSTLDIAQHYLLLALAMIAVGTIIGILGGIWLGKAMTDLYGEYFSFPVLEYRAGWTVVAGAILISSLAATVGAISSVLAVVQLPPAEAMRPEAPADYRAGLFERAGLQRVFSPINRITLRNIVRQPLKAAFATLGIALAASLLFTGFYFLDAISHIIAIQFDKAIRENVLVTFYDPRPGRAKYELLEMPGVFDAEFFRSVPVRLRSGYRSKRVALLGSQAGAELHRIIDKDGVVYQPPADGVMLSSELAERLDVGLGDSVTAEVLEGSRPVKELTVTKVIDEMMGLNAYTEIGTLNRLMNEDDVISGAYLAVEPDKQDDLYISLKRMPSVAGVGLPAVILKGFNDTFARTINVFNTFLVLFSATIVFGVVYNSARIALAERGRELASLRVLGFTKGEISQILFGEQVVLTILAIPFGYLIGFILCYMINNLIDREIIRLPLVFSDRTFLLTALIVVAASVISSFVVSLRLRSLDLIEVLKTRE